MDAVIALLITGAVAVSILLVAAALIRRARHVREHPRDAPALRAPALAPAAGVMLAIVGLVITVVGAAEMEGALGEESGDLEMPVVGLVLFGIGVGMAVASLQWEIRAEPDAISQVTSWGSVRRIRYQDVEELRIDKDGQFRVIGSDGTTIRSTGRSDPGPVLEALIRGAGLVRVPDLEETVFRRPGR